MTERLVAPGLSADWLNGWLAAIGVTVAVPGTRLSWSDEAIPVAIFSHWGDGDLSSAIARALPPPETSDQSTIAFTHQSCTHELDYKVSLDAYRERVKLARATPDSILCASVSDLDFRPEADLNNLGHGAFYVPASAPGGHPRIRTLWWRARSCAEKIPPADLVDWVRHTLNGTGKRVTANGLGFDPRRLPSGVRCDADGESAEVKVDPVVELLAFTALVLFPVRGSGRRIRQRGWSDGEGRDAFRWSAWRPALDRWGIDAYLDMPEDERHTIASYGLVPYTVPPGSTEQTRAYCAERLA